MASGSVFSGSALNREQQLEYHIGGVCIKFPCKPYPTQVAMMAKIIKALAHKENALLESPTGSGKSLALLCSTLAWQRMECQAQQAKHEEEQMMKIQQDIQNAASIQCVCQCHVVTTQPPTHTPSLSVNQTPPTSLHASLNHPTPPQQQTQFVDRTSKESVFLPSVVGGVTLPRMILSPQTNENTPKIKSLSTTSNQIAATGSTTNASCSDTSEVRGVKGEPVKGGADVIVLDDSLEEDFKMPRKRLRTPSAAGVSKTKKMKGVAYEDVSDSNEVGEFPPGQHGHATWRMECTTTIGGVAPGVGIPPSQIMDTGLGTNSIHSTASTSASASTSISSRSCVKCGCQPKSVQQENLAKQDTSNRINTPKIYFGTRTHKQITQITHEMARTVYSDTPMSILASREHTCIHPQVSTGKNKNDECKKLLDYDGGVSCTFYHRLQQKLGSQSQLRQLGYSTAWDIEDLVTLGKRIRACPYFATRALLEDADIIFCPYNYLIDPMIREQMMIDIQEKVIVLDEAHNMEDSAREAASLSITAVQLTEILKEIQDVLDELNKAMEVFSRGTSEREDCEELRVCYLHLQALGRSILRWIDTISPTLSSQGYEQAYGIWNGHDFVQILDKDFGLTPFTIDHYKTHIAKITEELKSSDRDNFAKLPAIPTSSLNVFKSLLIVVGYLFKDGMKYLPDYRISLMKTSTMARRELQSGEWMSKRKRRSRALEKVWTFSLNFWCLNPAVAFSDLSQARSIILTSGTLSPMSSFSSELGVAFPIQLEANHVIPLSQTWVRSISHGPNGRPLNSTYQHSETFDFQDELGEAILEVCQTVPHGVLCFLSSYNMLEKLTKRWQDTGVWYKILKEKLIVSEPRSGSKADFEAVMSSFYEVIEESSHMNNHELDDSEDGHGSSGALFLAVCRGKVSEGLDFADNNARAVITVGIPFPYLRDKQVELKREYNNEHSHKRGLLTGSEWYEIQAYRALNQALGRCIRHKKDWGALILIDERYAKGPHYTKGLSKWVRQRINHMADFQQAMSSLQGFVKFMIDNDSNSTTLFLVEKSPQACVSMATSMCSPHPSLPHKSESSRLLSTSSLDVTAPPPTSPAFPLTSTPHTSRITTRVFPITTLNESKPLRQAPPTSGHASQTSLPSPTYFGVLGEILSQHKLEEQKLFHNSSAVPSPSIKKKQTPLSLSFNKLPAIQSLFQYPGSVKQAPVTVSTKVNDGGKSAMESQQDSTLMEQSGTDIVKGQENLIQQDKPAMDDICDKTKAVEPDKLVSIASTPPSPLSHAESPVLFETPAIGGDGPKLISAEQECKHHMEVEPATTDTDGEGGLKHKTNADNVGIPSDSTRDDDQTPPISPEKCPPQHNSDGGRCDSVKGEGRRSTRSNTCVKTGVCEPTSGEMAFGQVTTRRPNTRMAKKCEHRLSSPVPAGDSDDVDFKPARSMTPLKLRNEHQSQASVCSKVLCYCGHTIAESASVEQVNLKAALKGCYNLSVISSSQLWKKFKGWNKSTKKKSVPVVIATSSDVVCTTQKADGGYNAVWDEKLELCYSHLQCGCGSVVGVKVHSINSSHTPLLGKAIFHTERISLK